MKKTILSMFAVLALIAGPMAHASILLEPYAGYYSGTGDNGTTENDLKGMTYGARLGFQQLGLMAGFDFMGGNWTLDATPSQELIPTEAAFFVGYNFPMMVRVYGAYGFNASLKVKEVGEKFEGSSMKAGIGFTSLPLVSVNLEYSTATYNKFAGNDLSKDFTRSMYGLSLSIPLNF